MARHNNIGMLAVIALIGFQGCIEERKESPTKGQVTVISSESVMPMVQAQEQKFEELYAQAHIELLSATDREAVSRLLSDSITIIVTSRALNAEERDVQDRMNMTIAEYKIAYDGVAVVVNLGNPISRLRTTQLDSILRGIATTWKSLGGESTGKIEVCLPSRNSGEFEVLTSKVTRGAAVAVPAAVTQTSLEMITYVKNHPDAIGFVGLCWLSNQKEKVQIVELADPHAPDSLGIAGKYFGAHTAYVYQRFYPLTHEIFIYSRADNYGVAAGFLTFITSGPGQKIVLNSGLVPATMPVRLVETTNRPIK